MVRGQYIAGTGMMLQRKLMENVVNNITNVDTTGYKKNYLVSQSFNDVLVRRINDNKGYSTNMGTLNFGTRVDQVFVDYISQGNFEETERSTDLALSGDVFFTLETQNGERYSKSGAFVMNQQGYLTDGQGNYLLGNGGRIYVGNDNFAIDTLGNIFVDGQLTDQLRLVSFEDVNALRRQGNNLYFAEGGVQPIEPVEYTVLQGFVENSNVDAAREMVDLMTVYRAYETNQRMLTMIDETVGKAVTEIGRLR